MCTEIELEKEFKKIKLREDSPGKESAIVKCQSTATCSQRMSSQQKPLEALRNNKDKRRKVLIRPSRLKVIGRSCMKAKEGAQNNDEEKLNTKSSEDIDAFTRESFTKMRISPLSEPLTSSSNHQTVSEPSASPTSTSLNCSTQAKLQQQISASSSSEYSSTIDEMAEYLGFHLSLYSHDNNFLVDSMYT